MIKRRRRRARENPIAIPILAVSGIALVISILLAKKAKAAPSTAAGLPTPQSPPLKFTPGPNGGEPQPQTSPIVSGKPNVIVGPSPFDPVSTDWKRKNAPSWWPW